MARARNRDAETARVAKLRQEKNAAEKVLRRENVDYADFMEAVSKWLRVDAAIIGGKTFAVLDADDVYAARVLNRETVADIHALFESCHELRYAGTAGGGENLSPQRRAEVREILRAYERAPRHV